ncbi:hypothetical protein BGZ59_003393 [Podila verticillata]|nr:hypothetical protein BGZ59_003393 [Podila verticillata]KFH65409.1 hypothetical protein MVEG_08887 [Podila verticillata NRRL 6337]
MKGPSILLLATLATLLTIEAAPIAPFALDPSLLLQKRQHIPTTPLVPAPDSPPTKAPPETTPAPKPKPPTTPEILPPETTPAKPDPPPPQPTTPHPSSPPPPSPPPPPQTQPQPKPSNPDPHSITPKPSHSPSHHTDASTPSSSASDADVTTPTVSGGDPNGEGGVPTQVSDKVFIGLGTVGGLLVFALGGIAFCRHRRKKNLAKALLEQTAQFNNNNPYAKMDEPDVMVKESLPMTPTKPLGTFSVVTTYTPALADEIEVGLGDSVTILQEFDDGWCLGVNNTRGRIRGVFPSHCVDMGQFEYGDQQQQQQHQQQQQQYNMPNPSFKQLASKRMSSMAPAQGWNGYYGHGQGQGGYDHYPPAPAYHGHHNHNGHNGYNQGGYYDQGY